MDYQLSCTFEAVVTEKRVPGVAAVALDRSGDIIFKGTFGTTNLDDPSAAPLTSSTPIRIFSCTKLITTVAALQLLEEGKIQLDDPVERYVPWIKQFQVLEGFGDDDVEPVFRAPRTKATILHLMTHTGDFTYDFVDKDTFQWRNWYVKQNPSASLVSGMRSYYEFPFVLTQAPSMPTALAQTG